MGLQQSKDELLYQQVSYCNVDGIRALHSQGAGLEWIDADGKTPLILACLRHDLFPVAKALIEMGANVNAYRPGSHAGTPLHHAAKKGLDQTVDLLLSSGVNPFILNDDCHTPLDLAREKGHYNVVRTIESRISLFSGWLREQYGPGFLEVFVPQLMSRKIWAVVIPCDSRNPTNPLKFELAIYPDLLGAKPRAVISLWKANIEEPKFNQIDPSITIVDKATKTRYKFLSAREGDKQQLRLFTNACRGVSQVNNTSLILTPGIPNQSQVIFHPSTTSAAESLSSDGASSSNNSAYSGWQPSSIDDTAILSGQSPQTEPTKPSKGLMSEVGLSTTEPETFGHYPDSHVISTSQEASMTLIAPSAPPITDDILFDGRISYPSIDSGPVNITMPVMESTSTSHGVIEGASTSNFLKLISSDVKEENTSKSSICVICMDAPVQGACIPCGHMAGCMSCLGEIQAKNWGCPVCRAKIDQVIRLYAV